MYAKVPGQTLHVGQCYDCCCYCPVKYRAVVLHLGPHKPEVVVITLYTRVYSVLL
jgi:hypothetical protein